MYLLTRSTERKFVDSFAAAELETFVLRNLQIVSNFLFMFLANQRPHPRPAVSRVTDGDLPMTCRHH